LIYNPTKGVSITSFDSSRPYKWAYEPYTSLPYHEPLTQECTKSCSKSATGRHGMLTEANHDSVL